MIHSLVTARLAKRKAPVEKLIQKQAKLVNSIGDKLENSIAQVMLKKLGEDSLENDENSDFLLYQYNLLNSAERPYKRSIFTVTGGNII